MDYDLHGFRRFDDATRFGDATELGDAAERPTR
jgi:hypothetical protein